MEKIMVKDIDEHEKEDDIARGLFEEELMHLPKNEFGKVPEEEALRWQQHYAAMSKAARGQHVAEFLISKGVSIIKYPKLWNTFKYLDDEEKALISAGDWRTCEDYANWKYIIIDGTQAEFH